MFRKLSISKSDFNLKNQMFWALLIFLYPLDKTKMTKLYIVRTHRADITLNAKASSMAAQYYTSTLGAKKSYFLLCK